MRRLDVPFRRAASRVGDPYESAARSTCESRPRVRRGRRRPGGESYRPLL